MHRRISLSLLSLVAILCAPATTAADEGVAGDGFELRVPTGFQRLPGGDPTCASQHPSLTGGLVVERPPEVIVYYAGPREAPDAVAFIARIDLAAGHEIHTVPQLKGYVLSNLKLDDDQLNQFIRKGRIRLEPRRVGAYEALEMTCAGNRAAPTATARATKRVLTVPGGEFLVVVAHVSMDGLDATALAAWDYMLTSLQVELPGAGTRRTLLYGGIAFAGLILLVLGLRLTAVVRRRRVSAWLTGTVRRPAQRPKPQRTWPDLPSVHVPEMDERPPAPPSPVAPPIPPEPVAAPAPDPAPVPVPATAAPAGSGLRPTLPPSGRWSD